MRGQGRTDLLNQPRRYLIVPNNLAPDPVAVVVILPGCHGDVVP
jgi:hypothetical protein